MENYLEKNYIKAIESLTCKQGIAKESGNPYYYIDLLLKNGYKKKIFLNSESQFAFTNAFDLADTEVQVTASL